jgi:hypothetical protein
MMKCVCEHWNCGKVTSVDNELPVVSHNRALQPSEKGGLRAHAWRSRTSCPRRGRTCAHTLLGDTLATIMVLALPPRESWGWGQG